MCVLMTPVVRRQLSWKNLVCMVLAPTLRMFEEAMLIPICAGKYKDSWDFYAQNNPMTSIKNIKVPTLIISTVDDPVCPPPLASEVVFEDGNVAICEVEHGGHLGFFQSDLYVTSWADRVCGEFVLAVLKTCGGGGECGSPKVNQRKGGNVSTRRGSLRAVALGF